MSKQKDTILINRPWIDEEERREVRDVLHENTFTSASMDGGKRVRDFESLLRNYLHVKHVIAVNSGTAALHSALLASGIKQDDEVLPSVIYLCSYCKFYNRELVRNQFLSILTRKTTLLVYQI